jgi:hypothetical protein
MSAPKFIITPNQVTAYALPNGKIIIVPGIPRSNLANVTPLIDGGIEEVYAVVSRHAKQADDGTFLVPGIEEAAVMGWDPAAKIEAFRTLVQEALTRLVAAKSNPQPAANRE